MRHPPHRLLLGAIIAASLAPAANAADAGFYAGVSAGYSKVDFDVAAYNSALTNAGAVGVSTNSDDSDTGFKVFAGYQFNPYLGIEAGYTDSGEVSLNSTFVGGAATIKAEGTGWQGSVVGTLPISNSISAFGKVGFFAWDLDATIAATGPGGTASGSASTDGTDHVLGAGLNWKLNNTTGIRAEWERYRYDDTDNDFFSVGVSFRF